MNNTNEMSESDWKILKELKPLVLDRLCALVLQKVAQQCDSPSETNHQRFLKARSLIEAVNKDLGQIFDDMPRSNALERLRSMVAQELITEEELLRFSEETRSKVWWIENGP